MIEIRKNIELKSYTTFKIGGPAKFFTEVKNEDELIEALEYAKKNNLEFFILGGGSNILVSDKGFNGIVIKLQGTKILLSDGPDGAQNAEIECWSGNSLANLVNFAAENNLAGIEELAGIPGTVGGAIKGNAGAYSINETGIGKLVNSVKVLDARNEKPEVKTYPKEECKFGYRESLFKKDKDWVILSAFLKLKKSDKNEIKEKISLIIKKRNNEKPKDWVGSAGSFYKNPSVDNLELIKAFEKETGRKAIGGNVIPAFWLISEAGLSGKKIGDAKISEKNNNFIINIGDATAENVIMLSSLIKQQVRDKFGIELQEEVQYLGF